MTTWMFWILLAAIVLWRVILPSMKFEKGKDAAPSGAAYENLKKAMGVMKGHSGLLYGLLFGAIVLLVLWIFRSSVASWSATSLESPSPYGIRRFMRAYWFWIFILIIGMFVWSFNLPKDKGDKKNEPRGSCKALQFIGASLFILLLVSLFWDDSPPAKFTMRDDIPAVTGDCTKSCTVVVPAHSNSPGLPVPRWHDPAVGREDGLVLHCTYMDMKEDVDPCRDGPISFAWLENQTGHAIIALYQPKKR